MPVSKYWGRVDEFSASDATFLILGLEPDTTVPSISSHRHLLQRMHRAYLETCAHVRFCVEKDLDADEVWSGVWQLEGEAELSLLASVEMLAVLNQVNSAQSRRSLALYRDLVRRQGLLHDPGLREGAPPVQRSRMGWRAHRAGAATTAASEANRWRRR